MAKQRVIASGGTPVPGVEFTKSRATGRQVASTLRRGGVPIRTTSTKEAPPFPQFPRPVVTERQPQDKQVPWTSTRDTGANIASMLRRGGIPVKTTSTKEAPPFPQFPRPDAPPREPQFVQPTTISETLTGAEIAQRLRLGGVPVRTVGQETQAPAVDPKSMADPRAGLFSPEPADEPITQVERLTAQQLKDMGVPVRTESSPVAPSDPTRPTPSGPTIGQSGFPILTGEGEPSPGVPWSTQSDIPFAIRNNPDPYEWLFGKTGQARGGQAATASGAESPPIPQIIAKSGSQSGSQAEPVTPPIAVNPPPLPSELQDALDRQAKKRTADVAEMERTQEKRRRGIASEREAAIKAGFATKPWADFVRKWKQDPITGENVEDPESYIYASQGYLI